MKAANDDHKDRVFADRLDALHHIFESGNGDTDAVFAQVDADTDPDLRGKLVQAQWLFKQIELIRRDRNSRPKNGNGYGAPSTERGGRLSQIGRFVIRRTLGSGGFGIVYLAFDPNLGREVALKVPKLEVLASAELLHRFRTEKETAAKLDHPNIVFVLESGVVGVTPYIASTYIAGDTLAAWLHAAEESVSPRTAAEIAAQLADAVSHAHAQGVLHRDIKPSNILLAPLPQGVAGAADALPFIPKLTDFGLAKWLEPSGEMTLSQSGALVGTIRYMAPEQSGGGNRVVGSYTDVYAIGVLLYELLTRKTPFNADTEVEILRMIHQEEPTSIRGLRPNVPRDLETICLKCLEKNPAKRYISARALVDDLRRFLSGEPILARSTTRFERLVKWTKRRPYQAALAAVSALSLLSILGLSLGWNFEQIRLNRESEFHRRTAEKNELATREFLYAADMELADQALKREDLDGLKSILDRHDPAKTGGADLRSFEWRYLNQELQRQVPPSWRAHPSDVYSVAYSPDDKTIATGGRDGTVCLWNTSDFQPKFEPMTTGREVNVVAFSPDGRLLASVGDAGAVFIWDVTIGKQVRELTGHVGEVSALAWSGDGSLLATGGKDDKLVCVWRTVDWTQLREPNGHTKGISSVAFSADGRSVFSSTLTGVDQVRHWSLESGNSQVIVVDKSIGNFSSVALCKERPLLAVGNWGGDIVLWDIDRKASKGKIHLGDAKVNSIAFVDQDWLVAATSAGGVWFCHTHSASIYRPIAKRNVEAHSLSLSPDRQTLVVAWADGMVTRHQGPFEARARIPTDVPRGTDIHNFTFVDDGRGAVISRNWLLERINLESGRTENSVELHPQSLGLAADPKKRWIATQIPGGRIELRDYKTLKPIRTIELGDASIRYALAFSPDGRILVAGGNPKIHVIDLKGKRSPFVLSENKGEVNFLRFSQDGDALAVANDDRTVDLWNTADWTLKRAFHFENHCCDVAFVNGTSFVVVGVDSPMLFRLDTLTGAVRSLETPLKTTYHLTASQDGRWLGVASYGPKIYFVRLPEFELSRETGFLENETSVTRLGVAPDGKTWGAAGRNNLYWFERGTESPAVPTMHLSSPCNQFSLSSDGMTIAVAGNVATSGVYHFAASTPLVPLQKALARFALSTDGKRGAVNSLGTATVIEVPSGRVLYTLEGDKTTTPVSAISPDGRSFAAAYGEGPIQITQIDSGAHRTTLHPNQRVNEALTFDLTGDRIVSAGSEGTAKIWNSMTGELLVTVRHPGRALSTCALSVSGEVLATGDGHGGVHIWETATGKEIHPLDRRSINSVRSLSFSPDGRTLAVSDGSKEIELWHVPSGRPTISLHFDSTTSWASFASSAERLAVAIAGEDAKILLIDLTAGHASPLNPGQ